MTRIFVLIVAATWCCILAAATDEKCRKKEVEMQFNPGCPPFLDCSRMGFQENSTSRQNLLYVRALDNDSSTAVHSLFGTIGGIPSILLFNTHADAVVQVTKWANLMEQKPLNVTVTSSNQYTVHGFRINRIFRFLDADDHADVQVVPQSHIESIDLDKVTWGNASVNQQIHASNGVRRVQMGVCTNTESTNALSRMFGNGTLCVKASIHASCGRDVKLPSLLHSAGGVQFEVELDDLSLNQFGEKTRFALEILFVSSVDGSMFKEIDTTIDDEYTPGVFRTVNVNYPRLSGHVTWKPVCYQQPNRTRTTLTQTKSTDLDYHIQNAPTSGIVYSFFAEEWQNRTKYTLNLTLGYPNDGFYSSTMYTVWTSSLGFGLSEPEEMSLLLMAFIGVAIMVSVAVVVLFVCMYIVFQRRRRRHDDHEYLVNDEDDS